MRPASPFEARCRGRLRVKLYLPYATTFAPRIGATKWVTLG